MHLLSHNEQTVLRGDLSGVTLPPDCAIYTSHGIPYLFRAATQSGHAEKPGWLYVPAVQCQSIRQSLTVEGSNPYRTHIGSQAIECEGGQALPVLVRGSLMAFVVSFSDTMPSLATSAKEAVLDALSQIEEDRHHLHRELIPQLVSSLFHPDGSANQFIRRSLGFLARQWPHALASCYVENDGVFSLCLAAGDISLSDHLPRELNVAVARQWIDAIRREEHFLPAELMPDELLLLGTPPRFLILHRGLRSTRTEYLVAVAVPGDISASSVISVIQTVAIMSQVHDSQFTGISEVAPLLGMVSRQDVSDVPGRLLRELFLIGWRHIGLSRLSLTLPDRGSRWIVARSGDETPLIEDGTAIDYDHVVECLCGTPIYMEEDMPRDSQTKEFTRQDYLHNVKSQMHLAIECAQGSPAVLSIGSTEPGDHLRFSQDFFVAAAHALGAAIRGEGEASSSLGFGGSGRNRANRRLELTNKLTAGYFHELLGVLSVMLGQTELQASTAQLAMSRFADQFAAKRINADRSALDNLIKQVEALRDLCAGCTARESEPVSFDSVLRRLPEMLCGYRQEVRDLKGLSLDVCVEDWDFQLPSVTTTFLYDCFLSTVLCTMDSMSSSGRIDIRLEPPEGDAKLTVRIECTVGLDTQRLENALARIREADADDNTDGTTELDAYNFNVSIGLEGDSALVLTLNGDSRADGSDYAHDRDIAKPESC